MELKPWETVEARDPPFCAHPGGGTGDAIVWRNVGKRRVPARAIAKNSSLT